ncbi:hypothetical protein [Aliivibrio fischeri]|uniref:Uncharacterized protein n=1 Tax=Aliivibrio fischeri TaxID=668 RepID=A0A6N3Z4Y0_ALIFS|nr:hypothetical protein [Aliivibrio fischeri]MCE7556432.1 hypothetical protein [Aliivibrio fischeri]MCE7563003.1 hypothetical protein [Aliivibrio fischeri]MCE7571295.1 hypothetical protein [Aliivibrio fischeri]MUK45690.1 hypothetical protein [Aliivibrio fischeri]MUK82774.1 hypothetical protein [Aliivibrio fischeri]
MERYHAQDPSQAHKQIYTLTCNHLKKAYEENDVTVYDLRNSLLNKQPVQAKTTKIPKSSFSITSQAVLANTKDQHLLFECLLFDGTHTLSFKYLLYRLTFGRPIDYPIQINTDLNTIQDFVNKI